MKRYDPATATGRYFADAAEAEGFLKGKVKLLFQDKSDEIYQANPSLFSDYTLPSTGQQVTNENVAAFFTEIDIDHPVFSFIHVE